MQQEALWMACHQQVPEDSACGVASSTSLDTHE